MGVGVGVGVWVGVGVIVGVDVAVGVKVSVGVAVDVGVNGVTAAVIVAVGVAGRAFGLSLQAASMSNNNRVNRQTARRLRTG